MKAGEAPDADTMDEYHLRVYEKRSVLIGASGIETFEEGTQSPPARERYDRIATGLSQDFLSGQVRLCKDHPESLELDKLTEEQASLLEELVASVSAQMGRAIVGLTILQLCVKAIEPLQSVRLHKGGSSGIDGFGWREGISKRSLDSRYITPVLRSEGLLKLNSFGFMMTRTLAENYPYTKVYKAAIRGKRRAWAMIVEGIESTALPAVPALQFILSKLLNEAERFKKLVTEAESALNDLRLAEALDEGAILSLIKAHVENSGFRARLLEIAMHTLLQALQVADLLGELDVVPLSQMRSANKKHGNIGDVELSSPAGIVEAWDAKFGIAYLRDQLDEMEDKIVTHDALKRVGFVTSGPPIIDDEIAGRIQEIEELHAIKVEILCFDDWVESKLAQSGPASQHRKLSMLWLECLVGTLSLKRTQYAPIDEPCYHWLEVLTNMLRRSKP